MNTIDFCYWPQGYFELSDNNQLSEKQVEAIKNHLHLVFKHEIDPLRESQTTTTPGALNAAHNPGPLNDNLYRC